MAEFNVDAACEKMLARNLGEVRTWAAANSELVTSGFYLQTAELLYAAGAVKVSIGDMQDDVDEGIVLIDAMIVELPESPAARKNVLKVFVELSERHEVEEPMRFVGQRYANLHTSE